MDRLPGQRYHSLDALRAAMMLLGLVLHSAASYTQAPLGSLWPYHDPQTSVAFDLLIFFIHLFRMPVFFVVAGFFAPAFVKFAAVLGLTTLITAVTYHYIVRSTMIGELLNGRRYPRSLPSAPPVRGAIG